MQKYENIAYLLKKRVLNGDYSLKSLPAERQLAAEVGVSYMTVRRALKELVDDGVLVRQPNGRLGIGRVSDGGERHLQIALLAPTFNSPVIERWQVAIDAVVGRMGGNVRPVLYMLWDDPVLQDSLNGFDGVFLVPIPERMPERVAERLRSAKRLVVVDDDMSHLGIPSARLFPPVFVQRLLDHLAALGHERIDCLNVHPLHPVIDQRIEQWNVWRMAHGIAGRLIHEPSRLHAAPFTAAYEVMKRQLDAGAFDATALMCVTAPAAMGAMRALHERGMRPGRDVAVCTIDSEGMGDVLIPSLTALESPNPEPYLAACLDWMASGGNKWIGPLLIQPADVPLNVRESTGTSVKQSIG